MERRRASAIKDSGSVKQGFAGKCASLIERTVHRFRPLHQFCKQMEVYVESLRISMKHVKRKFVSCASNPSRDLISPYMLIYEADIERPCWLYEAFTYDR